LSTSETTPKKRNYKRFIAPAALVVILAIGIGVFNEELSIE